MSNNDIFDSIVNFVYEALEFIIAARFLSLPASAVRTPVSAGVPVPLRGTGRTADGAPAPGKGAADL